jgi:hypothetical protein
VEISLTDMKRYVSVSRVIPAPATPIFDLLANPYEHHRIDGSGTVVAPRGDAPRRLYRGAKFSMDMKMGRSYFTVNTVVDFEENKTIAWCHWARLVWRYELEEVEGGTKVTESFDFRKPWAWPLVALHWAEKTEGNIAASLERLEAAVA